VEIETLDICAPEQLAALHDRLRGRQFDMLFVNAGTTNPDPTQTIGAVSTDDFVQLMITNALSPLRVIERLAEHVTPRGLIGVMCSGQGSIANNESGQRELYRGTKAALNMLLRSYAARTAASGRALVAMAPGWVRTELGWVRTELGGPGGKLSIEESVPSLVRVLLAQQGQPGLVSIATISAATCPGEPSTGEERIKLGDEVRNGGGTDEAGGAGHEDKHGDLLGRMWIAR
jgi:NAD(P)-dependent dehydrogenase (short-subunit alcohol dehydrogenase family)